MAFLYKTKTGREVTTWSYSSGVDASFCKRFFKLRRIEGYKPRGTRAAFEFGKCVEDAIRFHYESNQKLGSGPDEFKRLWLKWEKIELIFTAKENCWKDLYTVGSEMLQLFEILAPTLPIHKPVFQAAYRKELFPGTHLSGIEDVGYADIVSQTSKGLLLIDVKTAAAAYDLAAEFVALDPQLGRYSWHSGIRDVAFLTLVKARPESFESGDLVTILADFQSASSKWTAGSSGLVFPLPPLKVKKGEEVVSDPNAPRYINIVSEGDYAKFKADNKEVRGKLLEEAKISFVAGVGITLPRERVTKTRIEFLPGRISDETVASIKKRVEREVVEIERCGREDDFPLEPAVRGMDKKCCRCEMRGLCLGKPELADKMLVQIETNPTERDWLDELDPE